MFIIEGRLLNCHLQVLFHEDAKILYVHMAIFKWYTNAWRPIGLLTYCFSFVPVTRRLHKNNLEEVKFIFGWQFQRFSPWSFDLIALGARWGRIIAEASCGEKLLSSWQPGSRGGVAFSAHSGKNINPKGTPQDLLSPATPYCPTITTHLIHLRGLIHWLSYSFIIYFTSEHSFIVPHMSFWWIPHIQTITVTWL